MISIVFDHANECASMRLPVEIHNSGSLSVLRGSLRQGSQMNNDTTEKASVGLYDSSDGRAVDYKLGGPEFKSPLWIQ